MGRQVGTQFALALAVLGSGVALFVAMDLLVGAGLLPAQLRPEVLRRVPNYVYVLLALAGVLLAGWFYAGWVRAGSWIRTGYRGEYPDAVAAAHRAAIVPEPCRPSSDAVEPRNPGRRNRAFANEVLFNYQRHNGDESQ